MRVDRFFLRIEGKKPCLSMAGVAGVHQLDPCVRVRLPPPSRQRTGLFHGVPRKTHGGGALGRLYWRNLTLLAGAAVSTEEDRQGRGRGASSLKNLPLESRAIPATETRLQRRRVRRKPEKGIEGGRRGGVFIKKVRMRK
jgi:hypothetical protein